ncbi:MAG: sugar transferase [Bulleidia sp.]|nr:sugar transferase [Bulleidia sp.]
MYQKVVKRLIDIILSLLALILLSPLLLVLYLLVRTKLGSPVLFRQKRPGYQEYIFTMYKFRSMTDARDSDGELLSDEERLTPFGEKLRSSSLDELPELFNILKGDMSFVGPRPQLVRDMVFMTEQQRTRHTVRPGLTGLAQINGRNAISWDAKLDYDQQYVKNISFKEDVRIFFGTIAHVFHHDGISSEGMATALDLGDELLKEGRITREEYEKGQAEALKLLNEAR